jgi:uncharacterized protein (UPF0216 family)
MTKIQKAIRNAVRRNARRRLMLRYELKAIRKALRGQTTVIEVQSNVIANHVLRANQSLPDAERELREAWKAQKLSPGEVRRY